MHAHIVIAHAAATTSNPTLEIEHGIHVPKNLVIASTAFEVSVKVVQEVSHVEESARVSGVIFKVRSEVSFVVSFERLGTASTSRVENVVFELLEQL